MIGECSAIIPYQKDGIPMDIETNDMFVLSLEPTRISLFSGIDINPIFLFSLSLDQKQIKLFGTLKSAIFISSDIIAVLTSLLKIVIFRFDFASKKLSIHSVLSRPETQGYTAMTSYQNFLIAGDQKGQISIIDYITSKAIVHNFSTDPIISLSIMDFEVIVIDSSFSVSRLTLDVKHILSDRVVPLIRSYPISAIRTASSNTIAALFTTSGTIHITDFHDTRIDFDAPGVTSISVTNSHVIAASNDLIYLYDVEHLYLYKHPINIGLCSGITETQSQILVATSNGLHAFPRIFTTRSPVLFRRSRFVHFELTPIGLKSLNSQVDFTILKKIGQLRNVIISPDRKHYGIIGAGSIGFFNLQTGRWFAPKIEETSLIDAVWFENYIIIFTKQSMSIYVRTDAGLSLLKTVTFTSEPLHVSCDQNMMIISFADKHMVFNREMEAVFISTPVPIIQADPVSEYGLLISLLSNHELCCTQMSGKFSTISENVNDFFVDRDFMMLYVIKQNRVFSARLPSLRLVDSGIDLNGKIPIAVLPRQPRLILSTMKGEEVELSPFVLHAFSNRTKEEIAKLREVPEFKEIVLEAAKTTPNEDVVAFIKELLPGKIEKLSDCNLARLAGKVFEEEGKDVLLGQLKEHLDEEEWFIECGKYIDDGIDAIDLLKQLKVSSAMYAAKYIYKKKFVELIEGMDEIPIQPKSVSLMKNQKGIEPLDKDFLAVGWKKWAVSILYATGRKKEARAFNK